MSSQANAQEKSKAYGLTLDEIIVTAQKREESALHVPITVNVFGAQDIKNTGALNIQYIQDFIPGLIIGKGDVTQSTIEIRGVKGDNISTGGDPSVAAVYDDSYVPRAATTMAFSDIERIEVLKGPQGTLFGRNASAGVLNVVPNKPQQDFDAFLKARAGNYSHQRFEGMVNVALTDNLYVRANAVTNHRDGFINNVGTDGGEPGAQGSESGRISFLWDVSERTDLQLSYDMEKLDQAPRMAIGLSPEFSAGLGDPWADDVANDVFDGEETRDQYGVSLKLNHEFSDQWRIFAITSYRSFETTNLEDEDGTARRDRYFDTNNIEDSDIWYNELRLHFENERFSWITGLNYSEESIKQTTSLTATTESVTASVSNLILAGTPLEGTLENLWDPEVFSAFVSATAGVDVPAAVIAATGDLVYNIFDSDAGLGPFIRPLSILGPSFAGLLWTEEMNNTGDFESVGIFSDVTIKLTDTLDLSLGARYSEDKKAYTWSYGPNSINAVRPGTPNFFLSQPTILAPLEASDKWSKVTGRAVMSWQFTENALGFLSYSTGYKSGGYDALQLSSALESFEPEEITNLELGLKGDVFNDRLRLEFALFDQELTNRQQAVSSRPPGKPTAVPSIINGDQTFRGWELVAQWRVTDSLRLGLATTGREDTSRFEPYYDSDGDLTAGDKSTSNVEVKDRYTLRLDWAPEISVGSLLLHTDYIFHAQNIQDDPLNTADDKWLGLKGYDEDRKYLNARLAWTSDDEKVEVALWGDNLLDNRYTNGPGGYVETTLRSPIVGLELPRTWGVEGSYRF